jgi:hypothetical protein
MPEAFYIIFISIPIIILIIYIRGKKLDDKIMKYSKKIEAIKS